jgi:delta-aminolevulinic acid dehydratase/porphobilinogen synthase
VSTFPVTRLRRLRRTSGLRGLVRETRLDLDDFVMPLFVGPEALANPDLPGLARHSVDSLGAEADELVRLGVKAVILFGIPDEKAHVVAPSDMMDGRVGAIREELPDTPIIAYSAKYASAFYGPFREAAESAPAFGDRRGYQMDPANVREALRECEQDVAEGADVLMIKPALPYLDVIRAARERFDLPLAAYNVSGEYAMVKAAAAKGFLDERQAALESLTAIKRAGADFVLSYWTKELASWL